MSAKILAKSAFWVLANHVLSRGSVMLSSLLLARAFEVSEFASYAYFQLTVTMFAAYAAMGMGVAANRFFAGLKVKNHSGDDGLIAALITISVLLSVAGFALLIIIPFPGLTDNPIVPRELIAFGVLVTSLNAVPAGAVFGLEKYKQSASIAFLMAVALLGWTLVAIDNRRLDLAIYGLIGAATIELFGQVAIVLVSLGWRRIINAFPFNLTAFVRVFSLAGPMFLSSILSSTGVWVVGRFILGGASGEYAFALFSLGLQWFSLGLVLPGIVSRVLIPRLVACVDAKAGHDSIRQDVKASLYITNFCTVGACLVAGVLGDMVLQVYGEKYKAHGLLLFLYLIPSVLAANCAIFGNIIIVANHQWRWLGLSSAWFAVLCIAAYLCRDLGAWGGSIALTSAYAVMLGLANATARKAGLF